MAKIELGRIGAVIDPQVDGAYLDTAKALDDRGAGTIWCPAGHLDQLQQLTGLFDVTTTRIATGITPIITYPADEVAALYAELEATHPGRFVLGLGGAHGPGPLPRLEAYLDRLDDAAVPAERRMLAALGPRMLDLAGRRTAGALPILLTPEATAAARARLGEGTTLAVEAIVVVEPDPDRAREVARLPLGFLSKNPAYVAHFRRLGFTDDEVTSLADGLVDAIVPWGDIDTVAARLAQHFGAGADHLALWLMTGTDDPGVDAWGHLADRLNAA